MATKERMQTLPLPLQQAVGKTSLVRAVRDILNAPMEPRMFSVASVPNAFTGVLGAEMAGHTGAMAATWEEAAAGAIGECVERYCCTAQPPELLTSAAVDLPAPGIMMPELEVYSEMEYDIPGFPFQRQTPQTVTTWVHARRILDDAACFVPASMVFIPYQATFPDRSDMLTFAVSTGQACHSDRELALVRGLYEAIERDAFMITWLRAMPATRIEYRDDAIVGPWYRQYLESPTMEFHVFRLGNDIDVPTLACVGRGTSQFGPFACVGASTRANERLAAIKALTEAAQGAVWVRDLINTKPDWRPEPDYRNVLDFEDHVRLYGLPEMMQHLDFLYQGGTDQLRDGPRPETEDAASDLAYTLAELQRVGLEPVSLDITTPDVEAMGLCVLKVIIPGTAQLTSVHGLPALGSHRLFSVPKHVGLLDPAEPKFNPIPHPFP